MATTLATAAAAEEVVPSEGRFRYLAELVDDGGNAKRAGRQLAVSQSICGVRADLDAPA